ncbi:hypothetical protein [Nonomuraea dietziae]|uniref:hypothetical protein n=1 Tax=Nonomuraea dietziae TaxID=65515 RepID=UPI0033E09DA9
MAIHVDTMREALRTITVPQGPALLYVTEGDAPRLTILDRANPSGLQPRDRAICRALLVYAIEQIDKVTDPVPGEPAEIASLPVEVRQLVHTVDRMRDQWAEVPADHCFDLMKAVYEANDKVWNR